MALSALEWFVLVTTALQAALAVRLAFERAPWKRLAAILFALNAVVTLQFWGLPAPIERAFDAPTGVVILLLALSYPAPRRGFRTIAIVACAAEGLALVTQWSGVFGPTFGDAVTASIPLLVGFTAFLLAVIVPYLREPDRYDPLALWVIAGFAVRIAEFPVRYLPKGAPVDPFSPDLYVFLGFLVLLAALVAAAGLAAARALRSEERREDMVLVLAALGSGVLLGLLDAVAGTGDRIESLRRISLVVIRPIFVGIGAVGFGSALSIVVPIAAAALVAVPARALTTALVGPDDALPDIVALAVALLAGCAVAYLGVGARAGAWIAARPQARLSRSFVGIERTDALLLALRDADPKRLDERFTRTGISSAIGVAARNVHRIVESVNAAAPSPVVGWTVARGSAGQMKYFYHLTPAGRARAEAATVKI